MATPVLTRLRLAGALGEILVDARATARESGPPAVVLLHGFKGFKDWGFFPLVAARLSRAGFTTIGYNASGSGMDDTGTMAHPGRFGRNTFSAELADLLTVLEALAAGQLGTGAPSSVGLLGHSRGGGMAILGADRRPEVRALVTWAAISHTSRWSEEMQRRWRAAGFLEVRNQRTGEVVHLLPDILDDLRDHPGQLDISAAARRLQIPWLIAHGRVDGTVKISEAEALARTAPAAETLYLDHAGHTFGASHPLVERPATLAGLVDASVAFLSRHLT